MNKKLEAVVTDMDGTLLGPDWKIGEQDIATIKKLKAQGIPVFVATGRHQSICRWYFDALGTDYPAVTSNGALIYDFATDSPVEMDVISPEDVAALVKFTADNGMLYYLYTSTHCYLNPADPDSKSFQGDMLLVEMARKDEVGLMDKDFDPLQHTVIKFMVPDCTDEFVAKLQETDFGKRLEGAYSGYKFLDINPENSNKGVAVNKLARRYGFDLANTLAMGDNFNDVQMLKAVGIPVVPASAQQEIQSLATFVTKPHGDNPLTYAIESLFPELLV